MIDWKAISNGCEFVSGYAFKGSDFNDDCKGVPVIKIKNIQNDFVTLGASQYIEDDILKQNYKSVDKYYVQDNEILISMTGAGSVGRVGLTSIDTLALLNQRVGKFVPDEKNLNKKYLYHILTSDYFQRLLFNKGQGSGQPNLSPDEILEVEIPWPSYEDQVVIGSALHNLTNKITLLRQQNQDLEELAQTLFKRWFVEFEFPNENGEPYKSSGGLMVESELGEIPEGWRIGSLGDEFTILMGQSPAGSSYNENQEGKVFYQGRTDFGFRFPTNRLYTTEPKRIADKFDVLVSVRAPVGDVNMANEECCIGRGLGAVKSDLKSYCFNKIKSLRKAFDVFESEGTVFGSLSKNDFNGLEVLVPDKKIAAKYNQVTLKLDLKIYENTNEIQTLTQLRDTLLPKLMSGELRVKN